HLEPCEVLETLQQKIWRIKIETHRERGTKQMTEQRPDLLNMDGNDVTRAVIPDALAEGIWRRETNILSEEFI
ncbi:hypothetical protein PROFUN_14778, partial [Planoprotostelium fungivorum]